MSVLDSQQHILSERGGFLWDCCVDYSLKPKLSPSHLNHVEKDLLAQIVTVEGALSLRSGYCGQSAVELTKYSNTTHDHHHHWAFTLIEEILLGIGGKLMSENQCSSL